MKKISLFSLIALCSTFLTACDKPTTAPQATTPQVEKAPEIKVDTGAEDYKKFQEWQNAQENAIKVAMSEALAKLDPKNAKNEKMVQDLMNKTLLEQVEVVKASAVTLDIKDETVNALKNKALEAIDLGAKMMLESEKVEKNPTPETHKAFNDLQAKLQLVAMEGQKLEAELAQKYAPAQPTTPVVQEKAVNSK